MRQILFRATFTTDLQKRKFTKQIPPEANLYQATFVAFRSILNDVINSDENKADKKQIKKLRDISIESWLELVSLDEQEDNITEIAEAVLSKFTDEKLIENQFLNGEADDDLLSRKDWLILLLRLQGKEENYLATDLENKILDRLESDFTNRLRSVFSAHTETFQEVTLQLWETLFGKLDRMESKIDRILDGKSSTADVKQTERFDKCFRRRENFFYRAGNCFAGFGSAVEKQTYRVSARETRAWENDERAGICAAAMAEGKLRFYRFSSISRTDHRKFDH